MGLQCEIRRFNGKSGSPELEGDSSKSRNATIGQQGARVPAELLDGDYGTNGHALDSSATGAEGPAIGVGVSEQDES
jgi:hypothetical protein